MRLAIIWDTVARQPPASTPRSTSLISARSRPLTWEACDDPRRVHRRLCRLEAVAGDALPLGGRAAQHLLTHDGSSRTRRRDARRGPGVHRGLRARHGLLAAEVDHPARVLSLRAQSRLRDRLPRAGDAAAIAPTADPVHLLLGRSHPPAGGHGNAAGAAISVTGAHLPDPPAPPLRHGDADRGGTLADTPRRRRGTAPRDHPRRQILQEPSRSHGAAADPRPRRLRHPAPATPSARGGSLGLLRHAHGPGPVLRRRESSLQTYAPARRNPTRSGRPVSTAPA